MNRRQFIAAAGALAASSALPAAVHAKARSTTQPTSTKPATTQAALPDDLVWHDVRDWGIEGRGFNDTEDYFDRLPKRAKGVVRPEVWNLARNSAGMSVRFEAASDSLYIRYTLTSDTLAMPHMPATGVSGVDLYAQQDGRWQWLATHQPRTVSIAAALVPHLPPERRAYWINLPLYNGVKSLEIGVPKGATFIPTPPRKEKAILFYGTSITQGGCASRPGMAFVAILGRRLDVPMLNFGFSGNGRMEVEVARFLGELDPAIFVLDCMANMSTVPIKPRTIEAVKHLREVRSKTPILILEERRFDNAPILQNHLQSHSERSAELRAAYDELISEGVTNLHYRKGYDLIGTDGEATVDGSHPTDLGMMRYADALEPDLRKILKDS